MSKTVTKPSNGQTNEHKDPTTWTRLNFRGFIMQPPEIKWSPNGHRFLRFSVKAGGFSELNSDGKTWTEKVAHVMLNCVYYEDDLTAEVMLDSIQPKQLVDITGRLKAYFSKHTCQKCGDTHRERRLQLIVETITNDIEAKSPAADEAEDIPF